MSEVGSLSYVPKQVSILLCRDVFVCRTCLVHNCSVKEKLKLKRGEDVLVQKKKFCCLGDISSCYSEASGGSEYT